MKFLCLHRGACLGILDGTVRIIESQNFGAYGTFGKTPGVTGRVVPVGRENIAPIARSSFRGTKIDDWWKSKVVDARTVFS